MNAARDALMPTEQLPNRGTVGPNLLRVLDQECQPELRQLSLVPGKLILTYRRAQDPGQVAAHKAEAMMAYKCLVSVVERLNNAVDVGRLYVCTYG